MKVKDRKVFDDLKTASCRLNLGGGAKRIDGFYNVDIVDLPSVDIVHDLNENFSLLPDSSVSEIHTHHSFEHVKNFIALMEECHRILIPAGRMEVVVPHFSNNFAMSDPTHVRFFGLFTMNYFIPEDLQPSVRKLPVYYSSARFKLEKVSIEFYQKSGMKRFIIAIIQRWVNNSFDNQILYEEYLCKVLGARQIRYNLVSLK